MSPEHGRRTVEAVDDPQTLAARAAAFFAVRAHDAITERGAFHVAVSGGSTPWAMFARLRDVDVPWSDVVLHQVDERVAPDGDPSRNLVHLLDALGPVADRVQLHAMPVTDPDLEAAAARYADELPEAIDLVHLGVGSDGHTASLVPGDPVLDVVDRDVATTGEYQGHRRMTLTYPAINAARDVLWLVAGADKHAALVQLLDRDPRVPAGRVDAQRELVLTDLTGATATKG